MKFIEEANVFDCSGDRLIGIFSLPESPAETGVVVIVGGPQYRVGSHRQFVLLSRTLATAGYAVMRFDFRGTGDSEGYERGFECVSSDIGCAIARLRQRVPCVKSVVLWGLCDGASAALIYCHDTVKPFVTGLCLLNPWVRSNTGLARTQVRHYYMQRLKEREFWIKLIRGKVAIEAVKGLIRSIYLTMFVETIKVKPVHGPLDITTLSFQDKMTSACEQFQGSILLILSGNDQTSKEFLDYTKHAQAWKKILKNPRLIQRNLPDADHTFSSAMFRSQVEHMTLEQGLKNRHGHLE